jgi:hypothetical protein
MTRRPLLALVATFLVACAQPATSSAPSDVPASVQASAPASAGASAEPSAAEPTWVQLSVEGDAPPAREDHTWTLTPDEATAYLFGGRTSDGTALDDLWAFDLATSTWERIAAPGPPARFGHNAEWVDGIGLVVFAGQAGADFFNDLWAWEPAAEAWTQLPASGDVPVARYGSCAAVGPDGRLWISHGFTSEGQRFADTRAYDFSTNAWTDETPAAERPIERCLHGCWWTDDKAFVLYAGQTTGTPALGDLWRLTPGPRPGTNAWVESAGGLPPDRNLYASARWRGGTLVFGGRALNEAYLADLWLLGDDETSTALPFPQPGPPGRSGAELVATDAGRFLLFGGRDADGARDDLWEITFGS